MYVCVYIYMYFFFLMGENPFKYFLSKNFKEFANLKLP